MEFELNKPKFEDYAIQLVVVQSQYQVQQYIRNACVDKVGDTYINTCNQLSFSLESSVFLPGCVNSKQSMSTWTEKQKGYLPFLPSHKFVCTIPRGRLNAQVCTNKIMVHITYSVHCKHGVVLLCYFIHRSSLTAQLSPIENIHEMFLSKM